jgi:hypothetical protein
VYVGYYKYGDKEYHDLKSHLYTTHIYFYSFAST